MVLSTNTHLLVALQLVRRSCSWRLGNRGGIADVGPGLLVHEGLTRGHDLFR